MQGGDQGWLSGDSLNKLDGSNRAGTQKKLGLMRDTKCHCRGGVHGKRGDHCKSSFPCDHLATGHCPQQLWGQAQVTAAILGPRGGYELPLQDLTVGAKHCHHHPGSVWTAAAHRRPMSSAKLWPCCPRSVQTATTPRRPKSKCRRLPPLS